MAQPPRAAWAEAQSDEIAVRAQDSVNFAKQCVRRRDLLKRVRQQDNINRIARDGKLVHMTANIGVLVRAPIKRDCMMRPHRGQESLTLTPDSDLQELLAESPFKHAPHEAPLGRKATLSQWRREPFHLRDFRASHGVNCGTAPGVSQRHPDTLVQACAAVGNP